MNKTHKKVIHEFINEMANFFRSRGISPDDSVSFHSQAIYFIMIFLKVPPDGAKKMFDLFSNQYKTFYEKIELAKKKNNND